MTHYQITVRFGPRVKRYHTLQVEAPDVRDALRRVADDLPDEIVPEVDLVELRIAVDPEERSYVGEDE